MIVVGLVLAFVLGGYGVLRQAESKPSTCPNCGSRSLLADRAGSKWRCVPCQAQYIYWNGRWIPNRAHGPDGDEAIPTAKLRRPGED